MVANILGVQNRDSLFGDRLYHRDYIYFLQAKLTHAQWLAILVEHAIRPFDLARNNEHGGRVQPCTRNSGDGIGATRSGCDHAYAKMIGGFGVAFGTNSAGLLV